MFQKPALCLIGPKENLSKKNNPTICISKKYKNIADNYLKSKGINYKPIYVTGCVELTCSEGIADLIIDIVYTGSSLQKFNLKILDKIMQSDFLIIGASK